MTATANPRNLIKTLVAMLWIYGGRAIGLAWTAALIARLSIADYGLYGMAFALMAVIGPPLDNPYAIRSMREAESRFLAERTSRFLLGCSLIVAGSAMFTVNYIVWFGVTVAGGEIVFKAYQSRFARDGHADKVWRLDTIRQAISVGLGGSYLLVSENASLVSASLLYVSPYAAIAVVTCFTVYRHRPALPGTPRLIAALSGEMLGTALYLQGDVLLLGLLTDSTTVGYYTLCWTVAAAVAAVGQSYGMTYHEPLRQSGGSLQSGPPMRNTITIGVCALLIVLMISVGIIVSPAATELGFAMMLMAVFTGIRTMVSILQVVLYAQRRDLTRLVSAVALVPAKLGAVALLSSAGAVGAAIASVGADAILLFIYCFTLYRRPLR